ncbi:MAG: hypothetical protein PGN09_03190 [Sphingomonas fennica]
MSSTVSSTSSITASGRLPQATVVGWSSVAPGASTALPTGRPARRSATLPSTKAVSAL